jgi:hypothetical protein
MKAALILVASALVSSTALANPVMGVQELRGEAIAGVHVKLSYTYNYGKAPVITTVHGTSQSPWVSGGTTSRDTGSGVKPIGILVMCDCHVPTATTLDYDAELSDGTRSSLSASVRVAPQANFDEYPTSQDCIVPCQLADAAQTGVGDPTSAKAGGGCTFLGSRTSPALLGLALLGLVIAARRRRS